MQHGDKSHDDMTIEYRFRRHTIWFSMFMFAKDRVRVKKNRVSIIFFAIVPLSVVEMQKHAWFLVEPEVKQFNHRKNFLISKTLANLVIQFRNQFCAGASHKMLNWIWNTMRLIFFENANDIILQSMHWIVMGALFSADKKIGCCF